MAWRGEVEDGMGWGGLVASKSEQREEARLAVLERDAARYRWLRDKCNHVRVGVHIQFSSSERDADAAIDAAMKGANTGDKPTTSA